MESLRNKYSFKKFNGNYYLIIFNYHSDECEELKTDSIHDIIWNNNVEQNSIYYLINEKHLMIPEWFCKKSAIELLQLDVKEGRISLDNYILLNKIIDNRELEKIKVFE